MSKTALDVLTSQAHQLATPLALLASASLSERLSFGSG
jgi:hypothetical protein